VEIPLILYNVPGRTVADLANETTLRLAQIPNIIGIKDATASVERGSELLRRAPKDFAIYSGDDASGLALMLLGSRHHLGHANVAPRLMHEMCAAALSGELSKAREAHFKLLGLHMKLFVEANPIPVNGPRRSWVDRDGNPPAAYAAFATIPRYRQGGHATGRATPTSACASSKARRDDPNRSHRRRGSARVDARGCGTLFDSAKVEYKSEKKLPPLDVPPD